MKLLPIEEARKKHQSLRQKVYEAIKKVKLETPAGPFRFGSDRYGIMNMYICKVAKEGGERYWKVLETYRDNPSLPPTPEELKDLTGK